MSYNATLRAAIAAAIHTPADPPITGAALQSKLLAIVDGIDAGAVFLGVVTPASIPSTEANCFFLAVQPGTYANFTDTGGNAIALAEGETAFISSFVFQDSLRWQKSTITQGGGAPIAAVLYDVAQKLTDEQMQTARRNIGAAVAVGDNLYLVAGDIVPKRNVPIAITNKFTAQTTGGDADLKSGSALLTDIKGNLDAGLNPFCADSFVSTSMNLVDPSQTLTIGGRAAYYFPCVAGSWGSYGTTQENNGYIIIGGSVHSVYWKATKPTAESYGEACGKTTYNGTDYYTPAHIGWLTIVCDDAAVPACHVAWSNYNDEVPGEFGNAVKSIAADVQWIHAWGMAALMGAGRSVFDEIDVEGGKRYRRTDRVQLASLGWTQATEEAEGGTTYVYSAPVTGMAANGLWACLYDGLVVSGTAITIRSTEIDTVEALQTALDGYLFYYELDTAASSNCTTTTANTANDFGLTYFMLDGELATVPAFVEEGFYQSGKDQLFNAVTYQKIMAEVTAAAMCNHESRLLAIEGNIKEGFNYLKATNLDVTRQLKQPDLIQ